MARSSLDQCYIFVCLISRKTNFLFKNGLVQEWDISRQWICYYLSVIYQYVLVVLILLILYLWHARLRLLNFKFLKFRSKHDIIYISMMIWIEWCINLKWWIFLNIYYYLWGTCHNTPKCSLLYTLIKLFGQKRELYLIWWMS